MKPDEAPDPNVDEDVPASGARRIALPLPPRRADIPWRVVTLIGSLVMSGALVYYYFYQRDFSAHKQKLLAERHALEVSIAGDYQLLRARVEEFTSDAAKRPFAGDRVDDEATQGTWQTKPSLYVRVRLAEAQTKEAVHASSKLTVQDGLSGCLLRVHGGHGPWTYGEVVARAEMLGSAYVTDLRETNNDLKVRNLAYALEAYREVDFPRLTEAIHFAEYAVIALDEDPAQIPAFSAAYQEKATIEQKIASVPHPVRVHVIRLNDGKELIRVRRTADADVVQMQGEAFATAAAAELRRGQALGCAMAEEVLEAAKLGHATTLTASPPRLPTLAPVASASASVSASASTSTSVAPPK